MRCSLIRRALTEPATDLSRKVVRQLALMSPARDSTTMFCAACISSERVGDSNLRGYTKLHVVQRFII